MITTFLTTELRRQLEERRVVVWYDPAGEYAGAVDALDREALGRPGRPAVIARYESGRGYLALRRELEAVWAEDDPPPLLIYVPAEQPPASAERPLIEYEMAGGVVGPAAPPGQLDTALAAVARRALQGKLPPAQIEKLAGQLASDPPQMSLAELETLLANGDGGGVLDLIFPDAPAPTDKVLAFLHNESHDAELHKRAATAQMASLLEETLGAPFGQKTPAELRAAAARRILLTDLMLALGEEAPLLLTLPESPAARQAAASLAGEWRDGDSLAASYQDWAEQIEKAAAVDKRLDETNPGPEALAQAQTFACLETRLQAAVEAALLDRPAAAHVALATGRRDGYWSRRSPAIRARWSAILAAGQLLLEAERVTAGLKGRDLGASQLWEAYTAGRGGEPWCLLDRYQRRFERDMLAVDTDGDQHGPLLQLAARAREAYAAVAGALADRFLRAYESGRFELRGPALQADLYQTYVYPATPERVAYILVDAFRYEMAHELAERLGADRPVELASAVATPPTITEVGMAALMPGAEKGLVLSSGKDRLKVSIAGLPMPGRKERVEQFSKTAPGPNLAVKLDQLTPLKDPKLRKALQAAQVVLVTATEEIDGLCENQPAQARKRLDDIFDELKRAVGALFRQGIGRVVITADHGHLFLGEDLPPSHLMELPGGQPVVEKRRVWVGRGGNTPPGAMRAPLSAFGIAGEAGDLLELVTPYNLSCFKVAGGSLIYFHGGLSLPELVIPVLTVKAVPGDAPPATGTIQWTLRPGSKTISAQVLTVEIDGETSELLGLTPPRVTVEVRVERDGKRLNVARLIGASDGYQAQTEDIQLGLEPDDGRRIAGIQAILHITQIPAEKTASIVLLDAQTGAILAQLDGIPITIQM